MITYDEAYDLKVLCLKKLILGIALYFSPIVVLSVVAIAGITHPIALLLGAAIALSLRVAAFAIWGSGTMNLAQSKGHSPWWGLSGMIPLVGIPIVLLLPDWNRDPRITVSRLV